MLNREQQLDSVIKQATPEQINNGVIWYQEAHAFCKELSKEFGVEFKKVCAICAALSPLKSWSINKRITRDYLTGKRDLHTKLQINKCDWIMRGDKIEKCLGGLKTINFYKNILYPKDNNWVTIDRHMLTVFNENYSLTPKKYDQLKQACINYSKETLWVSPEVQAIAWCVVRGKAD